MNAISRKKEMAKKSKDSDVTNKYDKKYNRARMSRRDGLEELDASGNGSRCIYR